MVRLKTPEPTADCNMFFSQKFLGGAPPLTSSAPTGPASLHISLPQAKPGQSHRIQMNLPVDLRHGRADQIGDCRGGIREGCLQRPIGAEKIVPPILRRVAVTVSVMAFLHEDCACMGDGTSARLCCNNWRSPRLVSRRKRLHPGEILSFHALISIFGQPVADGHLPLGPVVSVIFFGVSLEQFQGVALQNVALGFCKCEHGWQF